jgi:site-specific recombinase XerD
MLNEFTKVLNQTNLARNTIDSYLGSVRQYQTLYDTVTKKNLLEYKGFLVERYKPKTINLRLQGMNRYLEFLKKDELKLKFVKIQQKTFLENVISDADYNYLKNRLKREGRSNWYFIVRFLAATGARISELVQIKAEHLNNGYIDIYGKGGKIRRIYIPKNLNVEALEWVKDGENKSGYLFLNKFGFQITTRGIAHQLKVFAVEYGINPKVVYPHSFRHRFAKNFLGKCNDIALLADLMGHDSIETTRIYLRRTSTEQQDLVNKIVTW